MHVFQVFEPKSHRVEGFWAILSLSVGVDESPHLQDPVEEPGRRSPPRLHMGASPVGREGACYGPKETQIVGPQGF